MARRMSPIIVGHMERATEVPNGRSLLVTTDQREIAYQRPLAHVDSAPCRESIIRQQNFMRAW